MTTLIQSCNQLRTDLQKVKVANQTRQEISALQQRMREWGQHANARHGLIEKSRIVDTTIMQREDIEQADRGVQILAEQAKKILLDGGNVQDLATESLWTRLTNAAESANELVRQSTRELWRQYLLSLGHIDTPSTLEGRMLKTPTNEELLSKYKQHFSTYQAAVRTDLPSSTTTQKELTAVVTNLQNLREQLNGSAPDDVRNFLKAVENGGAALELLTTDVMEWLKVNDDPARFLVKPRTAQTWR